MLKDINIEQLLQGTYETLYMSFITTFFVAIFGLILGIILIITDKNGIASNRYVYGILSTLINIFRSIPFIILIILILPLTKLFVGSIIGPRAFLPGLIIAATPLYARMVENSLKDVDHGLIEAGYAMGASSFTIIYRILFKEALPSIISSLTIVCISIISYSAMAGLVGGGGLGELARRYGFVSNNMPLTYLITLIILVIVLIVQFTGDYISRKLNKKEIN